MRLIEVMNSIPALMLLLAIVATLEQSSLLLVMAIIGLIRWTGVARFVRAEMLRIREQYYIEAGRVLGFSEKRMLIRHALPNGLRPVLITIAFGISGAILLEAFLSFLGIGLPADAVTWGTLLNKIKSNTQAWWLALFPGMAIFITVTIFNLIGEGLAEAMDS
jgi:peptide/nickel transport system permease protein